MTDQHRADHLSCYGNPILATPNLDRIAATGTRFDRFYIANPVCQPNRSTLMTGRLPSNHGVRHNGIPLHPRSNTFVHLLRQAGYHTAMVGKSHLQNMGVRAPVQTKTPAPWPTTLPLDAANLRYFQACAPQELAKKYRLKYLYDEIYQYGAQFRRKGLGSPPLEYVHF